MRKRIVILSAFLTPFRSGAEAAAEEVPMALRERFDFTIVTAKLRADLPRHDTLNGISVRRVGLGCSFDKWLYPFLAPFVVWKLKPDLLHAILETFAGLALHNCKFLSSAPRLLTLETTNRSFLKGFLIRSATAVTAISRVLIKIAADNGKEAMHISNGIPLQPLQEARMRVEKVPGSIVFVGRIEKMKGIDVLLRACQQLALRQNSGQAIGNWQLAIVGDGSQKKTLEELAAELGIADRVTFHGRLDGDALLEAYAKAEVFCGLSRSEALGNVFIEAQAAGCAVVGTTVGGIPDTVTDGETGLLVEPDNVDAAAEALSKVLTDHDLRKRLADAGVRNSEKYDWSAIAEKYATVYHSLLS